MAENGAFREAQKRHFSVLGARDSRHKPLALNLLCRLIFLAPESQKNGGRHYRARTVFTVMPRGRLRPDATNLKGDLRPTSESRPAQATTLASRRMSLYLNASVYAGWRQHNRATY